MRVIRVKHKKRMSVISITILGMVSIGLLIGGGLTGNVFMIGVGVAGILFTCVGFLGTRTSTTETTLY